MRLLVLLFLSFALVASYKSSRNPLKTKKYKCIEVGDDEEVKIVKKSMVVAVPSWTHGDEELRPIGSLHAAAPPMIDISSGEAIELPQAHKVKIQKLPSSNNMKISPKMSGIATVAAAASSNKPEEYPESVQKDHNGRPLVLSPQHCQQVKHYADMYGVTDVGSWVKRNCTFAKMYLPGATCEEINVLVASCYKNKYL